MNNLFRIILIISGIVFWIFSCNQTQTNQRIEEIRIEDKDVKPISISSDSLLDIRDGEMYAIVKLGEQVWMAQNLCFEIDGSWINPEFPSKSYGLLYDGITAQTICPSGWHLPSDKEWAKMEMSLGMPEETASKTSW